MLNKFPPGLRGALFYGAYWGVIGMCEPFLTVHFLRLGFTGEQIGWLAAVFPFFNFLIAPLVTRLADRTNRRIPLLVAGLLSYAVALFLFPIHSAFIAVLAAYGWVMASRSPVVPLADSLIAKMAERRQLDFGSMRMWGSLAFTLTSMSLGLVWERTGFTTMFQAAGIAFLVVAAAALLLEESPAVSAPAKSTVAAPARVLPEAGILFMLAANFLLVGALFMVGTFGTVYMTKIGGNEMMVGALFGLSALAEVPGMMFGRRIARKIGDTNALLAAYLIGMIGFAGFAFSVTPLMMLFFALLRGLGFGLFLVTTIMVINHRAPQNLYATYQGLMNALCWGLAPLLGGPIAGYIYQSLGPSALFLINAGMAGVSALLILPTYRLWRKPKIAPQMPVVDLEPPVSL